MTGPDGPVDRDRDGVEDICDNCPQHHNSTRVTMMMMRQVMPVILMMTMMKGVSDMHLLFTRIVHWHL